MSRRARPLALRPLLSGVALLLAATVLGLARPDPAAAAVTHLYGFRATVDAFTSWYGSYGMGPLGTAWCIDHGIRSPDPALHYVPADLSAVSADVQAAMAWAVAAHGHGTDRVTHAGLMLALHDLMGARYPSGRLNVDQLTTTRLAGFGGAEAQVLGMARTIKADGIAHGHLRGPLALSLEVGATDQVGDAPVTARLLDATGRGVAGIAVSFDGSSAVLSSPSGTTGGDGALTVVAHATGAPTSVHATATVPHLPLDAWAPTTARAQRVARPALDRLTGSGSVGAATGQIQVIKRGDATAWLSVEGARFRVEPADGGEPLHTVTTGADGTAPAVTVPIGSYRIVEEVPPAGYATAGPWTVLVEVGRTATLEATDLAERASLQIRKVDADTGLALAGASLQVRYDTDADGTFDQVVAELSTTTEPTLLEGLLPGRYEITETSPPAGYEVLPHPVVLDLRAGDPAEVLLSNVAVPPPTTTTTMSTTTTTQPPTTTTIPATTTSGAAPPVTVLAAPTVLPSMPAPPALPAALPRTGIDALMLCLFGAGLVLVGRAVLELRAPLASAAQPRAPRSRSDAMRSSS